MVESFFEVRGGRRWYSNWITYANLIAVRNVTIAAWACCVVGFGGSLVPPLVCGLGNYALFSVFFLVGKHSHTFHVPSYLLLLMPLAADTAFADYSLDALFSRWAPSVYPFPPAAAVAGTEYGSLVRKVAMMIGITTLFNGALSPCLSCPASCCLPGAPHLSHRFSRRRCGLGCACCCMVPLLALAHLTARLTPVLSSSVCVPVCLQAASANCATAACAGWMETQ